MMGMDEIQLQFFIEKISATAIANQAILKCQLCGLPLSVDNVILFVGDFFDPTDQAFDGVMVKIMEQISAVVDKPWPLSGSANRLS